MFPIAICATAAISILAASPSQRREGHPYYPMSVGDVWRYHSSARGEFRNEVVDLSTVEGRIRYRVRSTDASGRVHYLNVRFDNERVFTSPESGADQLLVDFGVPLKQAFRTTGDADAVAVEYRAFHDTISLPAGTYRDVREYRHRPPSGPEYSSYYARGIGLVAMVWSEPGPLVRLIEATIGGRTFKPLPKQP